MVLFLNCFCDLRSLPDPLERSAAASASTGTIQDESHQRERAGDFRQDLFMTPFVTFSRRTASLILRQGWKFSFHKFATTKTNQISQYENSCIHFNCRFTLFYIELIQLVFGFRQVGSMLFVNSEVIEVFAEGFGARSVSKISMALAYALVEPKWISSKDLAGEWNSC